MAERKFRKKPVVVEAVEWTGNNVTEIFSFCGSALLSGRFRRDGGWGLTIGTLEGPHTASQGDFVIKGTKGEFYPCKPDIFWLTYDELEN